MLGSKDPQLRMVSKLLKSHETLDRPKTSGPIQNARSLKHLKSYEDEQIDDSEFDDQHN